MSDRYDAIVAGLGAAGSAAAYHLARRGLRVLGLDRYAPPHTLGSSHGSRIIRKAYYEGTQYVALLERAYALWRALEGETGRPLLRLVGGMMIGGQHSAVIEGARRSAVQYGIEHEMLSASAVAARFPAFHPGDEEIALWEREAGVLQAEACIRAHLEGAARQGAVLHYPAPMTGWKAWADRVQVVTPAASYEAGCLVICAGGWTKALMPELDLPLQLERQVTAHFHPQRHPAHFLPSRFPIYIWEYAEGHWMYGFPDLGGGVKAGLHHNGACVAAPDDLQRVVTGDDEKALRRQLRRLLPEANGPMLQATTCFYTNMPDRHFLIDVHPNYPHVAFASACSGHGFKASSAVGEVLADLLTAARPGISVEAFRLRRPLS